MLCSSFPYPREFRKEDLEVSEDECGWGKRVRSHLWQGAWGPTAQSPIPCSSMWKMAGEQEEEGKEAKKSGAKRRREGQLVRSVNHQGNTHLIDMWNLDSSNKSMSSTTMYRSSEICWWKSERGSNYWDLRPRSLLEVAVLLGGKTLHKEIITHYVFDPFRFLPSCS